MGYIDDSLARGETILYRAQVHWAVFAPMVVSGAVFFIWAIFILTIVGFGNPSFVIGSLAALCLLAVVAALDGAIKFLTDRQERFHRKELN